MPSEETSGVSEQSKRQATKPDETVSKRQATKPDVSVRKRQATMSNLLASKHQATMPDLPASKLQAAMPSVLRQVAMPVRRKLLFQSKTRPFPTVKQLLVKRKQSVICTEAEDSGSLYSPSEELSTSSDSDLDGIEIQHEIRALKTERDEKNNVSDTEDEIAGNSEDLFASDSDCLDLSGDSDTETENNKLSEVPNGTNLGSNEEAPTVSDVSEFEQAHKGLVPSSASNSSNEKENCDQMSVCQGSGVIRNFSLMGTMGREKSRKRAQVSSNRRRFQCPIPQCTGYVQDLKRHLQHCHRQLKSFEIRATILEYKKSRKMQKSSKKTNYVRKVCPMCDRLCSRLSDHIIKVHKVEKGSETYIEYLKNIKKVTSSEKHALDTQSLQEDILSHFKQYLTSRFGGRVSEKEAESDKVRVRNVLVELSTMQGTPFSLWTLRALRTVGEKGGVLDIIQARKKKLSSGTMVNYCNGLIRFIAFLKEEERYWTGDEVAKVLEQSEKRLKKISLSYGKERRIEEVKRNRDLKKRILPKELMQQFLQSETWKSALSKMKDIANNKVKGNIADLKCIRDCMLLRIFMLQARRTGDLGNLTMNELANVEKRENGNNIILIDDHKNKSTKPCHLNLKDKMLTYVQMYAASIRSLIDIEEGNNKVFTTLTGKQMNARCIDEAVQSAWKMFGTECGPSCKLPKINPTVIRQSVTSMIRKENCPSELLADVAEHMTHRLDTAERYYNGFRGIKQTEKASQLLCDMYGIAENSSSDEDQGLIAC